MSWKNWFFGVAGVGSVTGFNVSPAKVNDGVWKTGTQVAATPFKRDPDGDTPQRPAENAPT